LRVLDRLRCRSLGGRSRQGSGDVLRLIRHGSRRTARSRVRLRRVKRCLRLGFHHAAGLRRYDFRSRSNGNTGAHGLNLLGRQVSLCVSSARHRFQRTSLDFRNRGAGKWLRRWRNLT
jgi:hypothetical protein